MADQPVQQQQQAAAPAAPAQAAHVAAAAPAEPKFNRLGLEELMKRRFIIAPAFQIYGGVAGLFDYGPIGCAIKANLLQAWRQHFVMEEDMLEVDCTALTPEPVLVASGHVAKFADFMVKDLVTGSCYRADHLLEHWIDKIIPENRFPLEELETVKARCGDYKQEELRDALRKYGVKSIESGNEVSDPMPFNLMFATSIGPTGQFPGYLRPETAQGMFVNFKRLLEFNGGRLPFAAAQIGNAYRNEIAPRSGLLRVREFTMAEIEHFVKGNEKSHPKFHRVAGLEVNLLSSHSQMSTREITRTTFGQAVEQGTINNQTLAYFIARTQQFLHMCGVKPDRLRFRQHQPNEMAHYAADCWDAEIKSSYGWVECVGHADRSCYDLAQHTKHTNIPLIAYEEFKDGPKLVDVVTADVNKSLVGKTFKNDNKTVLEFLTNLVNDEPAALGLQAMIAQSGEADIHIGDKTFKITREMVTFKRVQKKVNGENFTPNVIEPSFGIGRIIYSILEHSYYVRDGDEQRGVLGLPPIIAPFKVSVLPLVSKPDLMNFIPIITTLLKEHGISHKVDDTGNAIGRRYARTDEIGVPFGLTIDFDTVADRTVTLRERDSMKQIRISIDELPGVLRKLVEHTLTWNEVTNRYPAHNSAPAAADD